jgi:tetrahydromethanopterin S-methyltransferase subunit B
MTAFTEEGSAAASAASRPSNVPHESWMDRSGEIAGKLILAVFGAGVGLVVGYIAALFAGLIDFAC